MLRAERVQELIEVELEDGRRRTEYKTWGTFGGPMAYILSWTGVKHDIVERFGDWADGLKTFVEVWKSGGGIVDEEWCMRCSRFSSMTYGLFV